MTTKIDLTLQQSLIQSDFFLLQSHNLKTSNYLNTILSATKGTNYSTLNIIELTKTVKQLIRILTFVNLKSTAGILHIIVQNKQYLHLLKQFFLEYPLSIKVNIDSTLSSHTLRDTSVVQAVLLIDTVNFDNLNLLKKLQNNNIYLINQINSKINPNNFGVYKIYNDLFDYKKLLFIAILITKIFNKN